MLGSIFNSVLNEASIAPYAATAKEFIASLGVIFPIAIIALCLFVGLFGRRISGLVRFLLLFVIGFFAAVQTDGKFIDAQSGIAFKDIKQSFFHRYRITSYIFFTLLAVFCRESTQARF